MEKITEKAQVKYNWVETAEKGAEFQSVSVEATLEHFAAKLNEIGNKLNDVIEFVNKYHD